MTTHRAVLAAALCAVFVGLSAASIAGQAKPAAPVRSVQPIKGIAELSVQTPPITKRDDKANEVVTTIRVKNTNLNGSIARLKVEEYWYDKAGNPVTGASKFLPKPLLPGETATIELRTPIDPKMNRNIYQFSHANGQIKTKNVKKLD